MQCPKCGSNNVNVQAVSITKSKKHHGIVGVIKTFQMMSLKMSQLNVLSSIRKQVITLQDGITDMHIAEYMTQEDLNLKSLLKIFYIFQRIQLVFQAKDYKANLYMVGMVQIQFLCQLLHLTISKSQLITRLYIIMNL